MKETVQQTTEVTGEKMLRNKGIMTLFIKKKKIQFEFFKNNIV